jgi:tetratricopeptide (TPR) repeat protein
VRLQIDQPAAEPPADDPILTYYRGYCRELLGQSGRDDFEAASRMSLRYIFSSRAETIPVLRAALASNPSDASAHFLLGSLWFSRGIVDPAIEEWRRAVSLNPNIPSLDASLGRALLLIKKQPVEASAVFQHGFLVDPGNPALYIGLDQAMQQTGQSASKRAVMLQRFPDTANMPAELVRAQVNAFREDGKGEQADALLRKHFPPRQEGLAPLQPQSPSKPSSSPASKN